MPYAFTNKVLPCFRAFARTRPTSQHCHHENLRALREMLATTRIARKIGILRSDTTPVSTHFCDHSRAGWKMKKGPKRGSVSHARSPSQTTRRLEPNPCNN